jgi:hypothetical protein
LPWKEVLDTLRRDFTSGPVAHLCDFLGGGTRGFSQERRAPPAPTLRIRVPEDDPATVRAKAG